VGFSEIGLRPLRRVVGVRMIEANDLQPPLIGLVLDCNQLLGIDILAVLGPVRSGVAAADRVLNHSITVFESAQKGAATFEWISLFAVPAKRLVFSTPDDEHLPSRSCPGVASRQSSVALWPTPYFGARAIRR